MASIGIEYYGPYETRRFNKLLKTMINKKQLTPQELVKMLPDKIYITELTTPENIFEKIKPNKKTRKRAKYLEEAIKNPPLKKAGGN